MASHHQQLTRMFDALGLPHVFPEPEVAASTLARVRCRTLASLIVRMLNEEPCLRATRDGTTVTVREVGGSGVMQFTIGEQ